MILWILLFWYALARLLQLIPDKIPALLIVVCHVIPPALFAFFHGRRLYRERTVFLFAILCVGVGGTFESLSLRTGFPFGHYYFTDLMGPKLFQLPILLALAYVGLGYLSWIVSLIGLKYERAPLSGYRLFVLPVAASLVMTAWDFAMEPVWADVDRAWVWKGGGCYFGVPLSNFAGWFLTTYCIYQIFALYIRQEPMKTSVDKRFWNIALTFYLISAIGNFFVSAPSSPGDVFLDATGRRWNYDQILWASRLASVFPMALLSIAAWYRGVRSMYGSHTLQSQ